MRIALLSTTAPNAPIPLPVTTNASGTSFEAALAESSAQLTSRDSSLAGGSKTGSSANGTGRAVSKQSKAQSSSDADTQAKAQSKLDTSDDNAAQAAVVPPTGQETPPVTNTSNGQESGDGSPVAARSSAAPVTFAGVLDLHAAPMVHDLAPLAGVTSSCEMMEATNLRSAAVSPDASGDGDGQPVASTTPGEATQGANGVAVQTAVAALKAQMGLPAAGALPGDGVPIQSSGKATQKNAVDAAKNAGLANVTDLGKSKTAETVGATSDGSSHGAQSGNSGDSSSQSNGQPAQHFQGDFGQSPAVALKVFDASAAQVQAVPVQGAAHDAAGTPGTPGGSDVSHQSLQPGSSAASQPEADEVVGSSGINAATVIQAMGGTEMRVGMHSSEFGNISIRTSVSQQQMLTQISLDHSDLSQAIAAHVSAVQTKLGSDFGLNASIQVNHQGASMSGESGSPSQREQRAFAPSVRGQIGAVAAEPDIGTSAGALVGASDGYRLDIRA